MRWVSTIFAITLICVTCWEYVPDARGQAGSSNPKQQTSLFGSSGGNANDSVNGRCCSATLGSLLVGGTKKYILSNNHVIGDLGHAQPGDPICQPGLVDTHCVPKRIVAQFTLASPFTDNVDAAIAELIDGTMDPKGEILGIGLPSSQGVDPIGEMAVQKSGRSTNVTHGTIQSYNANIKVNYNDACRGALTTPVSFTNQIVIVSKDATPFSDNGDSGSLVMTEDRQPVGLLFSSSPTLTAANPIKEVLDRLSAKLGATLRFQTDADFKAESAQTSEFEAHAARALSAKEQLFKYFLSEPSVVGVGVGGQMEQPQLFVYVLQPLPSAMLKASGLNALGTEYEGLKTQFVQTAPLRAFPAKPDRDTRKSTTKHPD